MNTEFITKPDGPVRKHAGKAVLGLNAAAIVFLYSTFVSQKAFDAQTATVTDLQKQVVELKTQAAGFKTEIADIKDDIKELQHQHPNVRGHSSN